MTEINEPENLEQLQKKQYKSRRSKRYTSEDYHNDKLKIKAVRKEPSIKLSYANWIPNIAFRFGTQRFENLFDRISILTDENDVNFVVQNRSATHLL